MCAAVDERQAQQLVFKQRDTCKAVGKEDRWDVSLWKCPAMTAHSHCTQTAADIKCWGGVTVSERGVAQHAGRYLLYYFLTLYAQKAMLWEKLIPADYLLCKPQRCNKDRNKSIICVLSIYVPNQYWRWATTVKSWRSRPEMHAVLQGWREIYMLSVFIYILRQY